MIDRGVQDGGQVLNEGAVAPDVEILHALADAEDGFMEVEGVLEEQLVDRGARGVGGIAGGDRSFAVALGVGVETAAGKENAVGGGEEFGDAIGALVEGDDDGDGAGGVERGDVGREGSLVVFGVAGGFRYGNASGHGWELVYRFQGSGVRGQGTGNREQGLGMGIEPVVGRE